MSTCLMQLQTKSWCVEICRVFRMRGGGKAAGASAVLIAVAKVICCVIFTTTSARRRNGYPASEWEIQIWSGRPRPGKEHTGGTEGLGYSWKIIVGAAGRTPCLVCLLAGKPLGRPSPYADFAFTTLDSNFDLCPRNLKPETRSP